MVSNRKPDGILLLFPPLNHQITHAELGLPQLTGFLRARGWHTRQIDLNHRFIHDFLKQPERLEDLILHLDRTDTRFVTSILPYLAQREEQLQTELRPFGDPEEHGLIRRHLDYIEAVVLPPFDHHLHLGRERLPAGRQAVSRLVQQLLASSHLEWIVTSKLVQLVQHSFLQPAGFTAGQVRQAAVDTNPLLDDFLEEHLAPELDAPPLIAGLSIHSSYQLVPALRIARWLKKRWPATHLIAGGPWCTVAQELVSAQRWLFDTFDSMAVFEGEQTLLELARALHQGTDTGTVPGLMTAGSGPVTVRPPGELVPLERMPAPCFDGYPMGRYPEPAVPFRTIRGCTWGRCLFCYHVFHNVPALATTRLRPGMSGAHLTGLRDMLRDVCSRYGRHGLTLADNTTPPGHLERIAGMLQREDFGIGWEAMVRFDPRFTPALCQRIAQAGCTRLSFGLETSDQMELRRLHKGIDRKLVLGCLESCARAGIDTVLFVLNYPSEPTDGFAATLDFINEHADLVTWAIPCRFELGRNSRAFADPASMDLELDPSAGTNLSVFDLPFHAPHWLSEDQYRSLVEQKTIRFMQRKAARARR